MGGCHESSAMTTAMTITATNGTLFLRLMVLKLQYLTLLTIVRPANTVTAHASQRSGSGSTPRSSTIHTKPATSAAAEGLGKPRNQRLSATSSSVLNRARRRAAAATYTNAAIQPS